MFAFMESINHVDEVRNNTIFALFKSKKDRKAHSMFINL